MLWLIVVLRPVECFFAFPLPVLSVYSISTGSCQSWYSSVQYVRMLWLDSTVSTSRLEVVLIVLATFMKLSLRATRKVLL